MKNNNVKTVLGATILAATLSAQAQSIKKLPPAIKPKLSQGFEIKFGEIELIIKATKSIKIKDNSEDLKTMLDGSKTEGAEN